jgi:acid stress-induced BolA-like protein IbaG/YrbA
MDMRHVKQALEDGLPGSKALVRDLVGDGDHMEVIVIYGGFKGKGSLERHRAVHGALGGELLEELHSLKIQALTPEEAKGGLQS